MDTTKKKVAVIGALNVDMAGMADSAIVRGDSIPGTVRSTLGGVGWNIARNCALLGAQTAFFSLLGQDEHEYAIRMEGERFGVSLEHCRWEERQNNRYLYICDERGDVAAAVNDMALCARMRPALAGGWVPALEACDAVVMDANLPEETLAYLGQTLTVPLVADCVSAAKAPRLRPILHRLHTLKANRLEAETITGCARPLDAVMALLEAGVRRVALSMGQEGILCAEGKRYLRQSAVNTRAVDASGAGDSLTAALTVGLAADLPLERCASLGVEAAGIAISAPGAVAEKLQNLAEKFH